MRAWCLIAASILTASAYGQIGPEPMMTAPVKDDVAPWSEEAIDLPAYPKEEELIEFPVSAGTRNRFYVDGASLRPGTDGVVRYALVIRTSGGATNVTYEGIRCATGEYRIYATGRSNKTWSRNRLSTWREIENKRANRHHAALKRELFCPLGVPIRDAEEGRSALRRGWHPSADID